MVGRRLRLAAQPRWRRVLRQHRSIVKRADQDRRLRNYLLMMSIRTLAFAAAALSGILDAPLLVSLGLAAVAVVLPYPAVVLANAIDRRAESVPSRPSPRRAPRIARPHHRSLT